MKKLFVLLLIFTSLLGLSSCTNESPIEYNVINLAKAPDVSAYSNGISLSGGTRSSNVNGNLWYQDWNRPTNVTEEEIAKVLEAVKEPRVNAVNDITITWENFWVQQVYKGQTEYSDHYGTDRGLGSDLMNELQIWNDNTMTWWPVQQQGGYDVVNNFNKGDNQTTYTDGGNGYIYEGTTLMTDMSATGCNSSNQFAYKNSADGGQLYFDYIVIEVDGEYYVCFDFYADNRDNPEATANKDHYIDRDWIFNDWIVKISPATHVGETPEVKPETPTEPQLPGVTTGEVEVNLSIEERENWDNLASHLSIHVRAATDVEIFIPVPMEYYCEADDMAIVMKHEENHMIHGGPYVTEYKLKDSDLTVKLTVAYEPNGIRITTDGITQEVIDWCAEKCHGDGITFEIWNYFNESTTYDILKPYLNNATIEFLDSLPSSYINAFNEIDGEKNQDDCTVSIIDSQESEYTDPRTGEHLNGSHYNEIYSKN